MNMQNNQQFNYQIRAANVEDIPKIMECRKEMGIHDCPSCLESWIKLDPEGVILAVHESGEVIGAINAVIGPEDFSFFGLYFVRHQYRGLRIGLNVWNQAVAHVSGRNVGLHSVPEKKELYRDKSGFPIEVADFTCIKNITQLNVNPDLLSEAHPDDVDILAFEDSYLDPICAYDFDLIGYKRTHSLELSCKEKNSKTFVAMKDDNCVGFGTIKLSCLGAGRVGPLYADDTRVAEALLKTLIKSFDTGNGFAMMTVSNNYFANKLMKKLEVPETQHLTQLYTRRSVEVNTSKVFALFDLNGAPF